MTKRKIHHVIKSCWRIPLTSTVDRQINTSHVQCLYRLRFSEMPSQDFERKVSALHPHQIQHMLLLSASSWSRSMSLSPSHSHVHTGEAVLSDWSCMATCAWVFTRFALVSASWALSSSEISHLKNIVSRWSWSLSLTEYSSNSLLQN